MREETDKQTYIHADRNTLHLYLGRSNEFITGLISSEIKLKGGQIPSGHVSSSSPNGGTGAQSAVSYCISLEVGWLSGLRVALLGDLIRGGIWDDVWRYSKTKDSASESHIIIPDSGWATAEGTTTKVACYERGLKLFIEWKTTWDYRYEMVDMVEACEENRLVQGSLAGQRLHY